MILYTPVTHTEDARRRKCDSSQSKSLLDHFHYLHRFLRYSSQHPQPNNLPLLIHRPRPRDRIPRPPPQLHRPALPALNPLQPDALRDPLALVRSKGAAGLGLEGEG